MEQIKHAAALWADGEITKGRDHGQAIQKRQGWRESKETPCCGFITSKGLFVSRGRAAQVAAAVGQITKVNEGGLQSEELWMYGPYKYDDEKGYYNDPAAGE